MIGPLTQDKKVLFYEILAHNLTVSIRAVWSNPDSSDSLKVQEMKWINEIMHRVTAKIRVERLQLHNWPENEFIEMVGGYIKQCPSIDGDVGWSINNAFEFISK
ncbi:hypothetical protein [Methylomonas methanica]|uniref:Uncharacterized protein n=1 Tax=Methylomonas methanica (strain DSM 25384 / MC09) TaxID=857087 RepID=G0A3G2_METMM|nr:hypothetical protein [Methylomonas methanica]AEG00261.1 hypothetical protein Metme_1845 [Methylomonas methanica MC09]